MLIQLYLIHRWMKRGGIALIDEPFLYLHSSLFLLISVTFPCLPLFAVKPLNVRVNLFLCDRLSINCFFN